MNVECLHELIVITIYLCCIMDFDISEYFYQGRVVSSKEEFQDAVVMMAAFEHRFEVMAKVSESHKARYTCKGTQESQEASKFEVYAPIMDDGGPFFTIVTVKPVHMCTVLPSNINLSVKAVFVAPNMKEEIEEI